MRINLRHRIFGDLILVQACDFFFIMFLLEACVVWEERVRVGAGRYRRSGQLCSKCAWVPLRPVNHTLSASKWIVGGRGGGGAARTFPKETSNAAYFYS